MNDKYNAGDHVFCIFNSSIQGKIIKRYSFHGFYCYLLKVEDEESFLKHFGLGSTNVIFLHYQLRRI